jgi:hypothetical protein
MNYLRLCLYSMTILISVLIVALNAYGEILEVRMGINGLV